MAYASAVVINAVDVTSSAIETTTLPTTPTATHGNKFYHDGRSFFEILNAGAELTMTVDTPKSTKVAAQSSNHRMNPQNQVLLYIL